VLTVAAQRLREAAREGDTVARVGSDEFAVLCECVRSHDELVSLADRFLRAMSRDFTFRDKRVYLGARLGIAVAEADASSAIDLLRDAETALGSAKHARKPWAVYDPCMRERARCFLQTASDLRDAVSHRQLAVEYQPIVTLPDGHLFALEALARWNHPQRGRVPPADFIPVAEHTGLIGEIGDWVFQEGIASAKRWIKYWRRFRAISCPERFFRAIVTRTGCSPRWLRGCTSASFRLRFRWMRKKFRR
jgi:predicted signal transduction protein with EAL and GGDEF domain